MARGVLFVNPTSGADATDARDLRRRFNAADVEVVEPEDLVKRVRIRLSERPSFVGVAGGDGTIRSVVEQLVGDTVPLLVVPAGTRNHFAAEIGVNSLDDAAACASLKTINSIDTGEVNGRVFLNNSSIGLYSKIVARRELHERRLRKGLATLVATLEQLREATPVMIEADGTTYRAWMVFVGNGLYGDGLFDLSDRESLDSGLLDVRIVLAGHPWARLRIVAALILGRLARSRLVLRLRTPAIAISVGTVPVEVALDGEVITLRPPLAFRSVPKSLRVASPGKATT